MYRESGKRIERAEMEIWRELEKDIYIYLEGLFRELEGVDRSRRGIEIAGWIIETELEGIWKEQEGG